MVRLRESSSSSAEFGAKHRAPHPARSKKGSPPSLVPPPSCVSTPACAPPPSRRCGRRTAPGSGEHKTRPQTKGQPGIFPTSRVTGVDSDCVPGHRQSRQRESCLLTSLHHSYPRLTPLADKEQIFCRQIPALPLALRFRPTLPGGLTGLLSQFAGPWSSALPSSL